MLLSGAMLGRKLLKQVSLSKGIDITGFAHIHRIQIHTRHLIVDYLGASHLISLASQTWIDIVNIYIYKNQCIVFCIMYGVLVHILTTHYWAIFGRVFFKKEEKSLKL